MHTRTFGRLGWPVSEVGYGLWGMGGWTGSNDDDSIAALERSIALGCTFFDTALAYGDGKSEQLLGRVLANHRDRQLIVGTKIPPKNLQWPARAAYRLDDVYPSRSHPPVDGNEPEESGSAVGRPPAVSRLDRYLGHRRSLAARRRRPEARRAGARYRHQPQSLGADQRHQGAPHGHHRQRAGRLQPVRSEPGGRAVPGLSRAGHRGDRARAV